MSAPQVTEAIEHAGLVYVTDAMRGISRERRGEEFRYVWPNGREVADDKTLERIRSLAIPPAYENVWICPLENGHLQATGKDARGRKQYRYHPRFREERDSSKYDRMADFADALPKIHERIDSDLGRPGLPRDKVLAVVVHLLEKSLIRVGNEEYAKTNNSYGLTTLRNRHVKVEGAEVKFRFLGKSKVRHNISLHDRRLARVVRRLQELPGQELFQYLDDDGNSHSITSNDVNAYLKEASGGDFTAKDFRTWAGTVLALTELAGVEPAKTKREAKANVTRVLKVVASQLGNTPAVCRKCYVHPAVLEAYTTGKLRQFLAARRPAQSSEGVSEVVECAEDAVKRLLKRRRRELKRAA
jgi:DNA topoisomerase-1